jgi:nudix-type nucleoside diphosphatase (YffH/AdpP family)
VSDEPGISDERIVHDGWARLTLYTIEMRPGAGAHVREVYDHGSAAAILLYDPERRTVLLVRQFRLPVYLNGDPPALLEVCAGLLEGKSPRDCAINEAVEETGHRPREVDHVCSVYLSPGSLTEKCACFIGRYDEGTRVSAGGGLAEEGEEIEIVEVDFDEAVAMIGDGRIIDAKTILLLQHLRLSALMGN